MPPLTVSQLTRAVKLSLESTFPLVHLQGEVSNFRTQSSGHFYFSLKDAEAQIAAVMFRADASLVKIVPKVGDQLVVKGELTVYPPKGNYQLIVRELSHVGLGELLQKLELLKLKLHRLGWFKKERKKPLPRFPRTIGVVTSPTGAVIQDILHVLSRRFSGFHLVLYPVRVQGEGAAEEIAQAIEQCNRYDLADVLIVGRGGGSLEDLQPFNEEATASAIYQSRIPIISAVGHETDHCIADYVADVRAPTPSAAAEIVIAERSHYLETLGVLHKRLRQHLGALIQQNRCRLKGVLQHPSIARPRVLIEWRMQKLDDYRGELERASRRFLLLKRHLLEGRAQQAARLNPIRQIAHFRERFSTYARSLEAQFARLMGQRGQKIADRRRQLDSLWQTTQALRRNACRLPSMAHHLQQIIRAHLTRRQNQVNHATTLLEAFNPRRVLEKGYSILLTEPGGEVVRSIKNLHRGQQARLLLSDGEIIVTIARLPQEATVHKVEGKGAGCAGRNEPITP